MARAIGWWVPGAFGVLLAACGGSDADSSGEQTFDSSSPADAGGDAASVDTRDTTVGDDGPARDTAPDDTAVDDTFLGLDTNVLDTSPLDTSFDLGLDLGVDAGADAPLCTGVTCPAGQECCPYAGSPFAGRCYSKACLACCTPAP